MTDHGGDWAGFAETYGSTPLDFSANVSPLGTPEPVRRAAEAALAEAGRYPDPLCRALREKLAAYHGVPADWILCGSGAADLIYRLAAARRPGRALVTAPTFSEYENALTLWECRVSRFPLYEKNGFAVTEDILTAIVPGWICCFCASPTTPQAAPQTFRCWSGFWSTAPPAVRSWRWTSASTIFWPTRRRIPC